nr:uncharacterized protein LOC122271539 [Parasteatoda tepidariorum]
MATYHQHGRGGKRLTERRARGSTTDEECSDFETKMAEKLADMGRRIKEDERKNKELLEKLNHLEQSLMPVPNRPEIPTTPIDVIDMETYEGGQLLEQTGNESTRDSESSTKNIAEPPLKKKKKKNNVKKAEANLIMTTNSKLFSPIDTATSLQPSESISDTDLAPPKEDSSSTVDPPTTRAKVQPIKHIKVLIRGLPVGFYTDHISQELAKSDIITQKIIQFKRKVGGTYRLLPLFLTILTETDVNRQIFSITNIQSIPVSIERFRGGQNPIQCYNCQEFGHSQRSCNSPSRCVKCAAKHRSYECQKDENTPPKCSNCGDSHTANYTGCRARPRRRGTRAIPPPTTGLAQRLVTIIKELQELLKNQEVLQLLQRIMGEATLAQ